MIMYRVLTIQYICIHLFGNDYVSSPHQTVHMYTLVGNDYVSSPHHTVHMYTLVGNDYVSSPHHTKHVYISW